MSSTLSLAGLLKTTALLAALVLTTQGLALAQPAPERTDAMASAPIARSPEEGAQRTAPPLSHAKLFAVEYVFGAVATMIAVPGGVMLGAALGSIPNNMYAAVVAGFAPALLAPPLLMSLSSTAIGSWYAQRREALVVPLALATAAHAAFFGGAILAGVSAHDRDSVLVLGAVEALVLPAVTASSMLVFRLLRERDEELEEQLAGGQTP